MKIVIEENSFLLYFQEFDVSRHIENFLKAHNFVRYLMIGIRIRSESQTD